MKTLNCLHKNVYLLSHAFFGRVNCLLTWWPPII